MTLDPVFLSRLQSHCVFASSSVLVGKNTRGCFDLLIDSALRSLSAGSKILIQLFSDFLQVLDHKKEGNHGRQLYKPSRTSKRISDWRF